MTYVNPLSSGLQSGRVDMGVDYTGSGNLFAIGSGTIVNTKNSQWPGGTFIGLKLDQPINGQQFVYYAENITPKVKVGDRVNAGQVIGHANGTYPYIEIGFAAPPGTGTTQAAASGQSALGQSEGDPGKFSTGYGVMMSQVIQSLGGKGGIVSAGGIQGNVPSGTDATLTDQTSPNGCNPAMVGLFYAVQIGIQFGRYFSSRKPYHRKSVRKKHDERKGGSADTRHGSCGE